MAENSLHFDYRRGGDIHIQERGPKDKRGYYTIHDKLVSTHDDIELHCAWSDDDDDEGRGDHMRLELSSFHVENKETGRAFHCSQELCLDKSTIKKIRDFLNLVLESIENRSTTNHA